LIGGGNGCVTALDLALREDLGVYRKHIDDQELRVSRGLVFQGGANTPAQ
jgi:hypothetical protein